MKLGTRARYSVRLVIAIGKLSIEKKPVTVNEIARLTGISRRYLDQLTIPLKNATIIKGHSGRGGGFTLAKPPVEIKVGEIIQAAIGPIAIVECIDSPEDCMQSDICPCLPLWELINYRITEVLNDYSLADLLEKNWKKRIQKKVSKISLKESLENSSTH